MKKEVKKVKEAGKTKKAVFIFSIAIVLLILSFIFDGQIFSAIQNLRSPVSDAFFSWILFIEKEFIYYPLFIVTALGLLFWRKKSSVIPFVISLAISAFLVFLFKGAVSRQRPLLSSNNSFPSGHAAIIFAALPFLERKVFRGIAIVWIVIAFLFSFVRIWFGLHYFSDVIAGSIIGYAVSFIMKNYWKKLKTSNIKKKCKKR